MALLWQNVRRDIGNIQTSKKNSAKIFNNLVHPGVWKGNNTEPLVFKPIYKHPTSSNPLATHITLYIYSIWLFVIYIVYNKPVNISKMFFLGSMSFLQIIKTEENAARTSGFVPKSDRSMIAWDLGLTSALSSEGNLMGLRS